MLNFNKAHFVISAPDITKLPPDVGIEIAFIGRSNAGKSSALNIITNQRNLAKTSKTPGRTQLINLFEIEENKRIVDLPGYGFAEVPIEVKKKWQRSLTEFLQKRRSLKAVVILMDIRHPLKDLDRQIITWATLANLQVLILLTKCDKLAANAQKKAFAEVKRQLVEFGSSYQIVMFSSLKATGVEEVKRILDGYYSDLHEATLDSNQPVTDEQTDEANFDEEAWKNYRA